MEGPYIYVTWTDDASVLLLVRPTGCHLIPPLHLMQGEGLAVCVVHCVLCVDSGGGLGHDRPLQL